MKYRFFFYYFAGLAILFSACKDNEIPVDTNIPVTGVTLNKTELSLAPGDTLTLIATIQPAEATNKKLTWTSSNPEVATVNENGLVTAIDNGETTISIITKDGNKKANCSVNIDYRNRWFGTYDFTTISAIGYFEFDFGWNYIHDTVIFMGTIEKYDKDRLKIIFKPNATEPNFTEIFYPLQIKGLIYPSVGNLGLLDYPEFTCDKGEFSGCFSDNKINISYEQSAGHFGHEKHKIQGIKINK